MSLQYEVEDGESYLLQKIRLYNYIRLYQDLRWRCDAIIF